MAIAAQRFKFLDQETNLPTQDLLLLKDNQVYNKAISKIDSTISDIKDSKGPLMQLNSSLDALNKALTEGVVSVKAQLQSALNDVLDYISGIEMPPMIKSALDSLKNLDLDGVKDFFKDALRVGSTFLCNNLDFLKSFMLGYSLGKNILSGLVTALLLSWLDRYCKAFSAEDIEAVGKLKKLEKMFPPKGTTLTPGNVYSSFTKIYADYAKATAGLQQVTAMTPAQALSEIQSGNSKAVLENLRAAEITTTEKKSLIEDLDNLLGVTPETSSEYSNLLHARGELQKLPLISEERRDRSISYSNLSDQLGSMSKNLTEVDLSQVDRFNYTETQNSLFNKIKTYQSEVKNNQDLMSRGFNSGSFDDLEFGSLLPELDAQEMALITSLTYEPTAHRVHDIHPTTSVFLGEEYRHGVA